MAEQHDYVVVGAGVVGLSAARELARRGRDVICLEQATPGHERSGSKGRGRILRAGYHDPFWVRLAGLAREGWDELAAESGRRLLLPSGLVSFGDRVEELLDSMRQGGVPGELLAGEELSRRFPGLDAPGPGVYESSAGVLLADEVLRALTDGGLVEVLENHALTGISEGEDAVSIEAEEALTKTVRTFECTAAVLCAGAWSSEVARMGGLDGLAAKLWASLQQVLYVSLPAAQAEEMPAVVWYRRSDVAYGLPTPGTGTYKLGLHEPRVRVDPSRASLADDPSDLAVLEEVSASLLVESDRQPAATERCFYDNSPDEDFVLDRVGRLVVGAGTSGHGFKFAQLVGGLLADLAEGTAPVLPIDRFSVRRSAIRGR